MAREKIALPSQEVSANAFSIDGAGYTAHNPMQVMPHYRVTIRQEPIIDENRPLVEVICHLPEELNLDTQSEYDTPFADGLINDRRVQTIMQLAGWSPTVQAMTAHFWRGSAPIEINLPLVIYATNGYANITGEVLKLKSLQLPRVDPVTKFLRPPGPRMKLNVDAAKRIFNTAASTASTVAGTLTNNKIGNDTAQNPGATLDANETAFDATMRIGQSFGKEFASAAQELIDVTGKISIRLGKFLYFNDVVIRSVSDAYNIVLGPDQRPQSIMVTINAVTRMTPTYEDLTGAGGIYQTDDPLLPRSGNALLPGFDTSRARGTDLIGVDWSQKAQSLRDTTETVVTNGINYVNGVKSNIVNGIENLLA